MAHDEQSPKNRALEAIRRAPIPGRALFGAKRREVALKAGATVAEIEDAENAQPLCLPDRALPIESLGTCRPGKGPGVPLGNPLTPPPAPGTSSCVGLITRRSRVRIPPPLSRPTGWRDPSGGRAGGRPRPRGPSARAAFVVGGGGGAGCNFSPAATRRGAQCVSGTRAGRRGGS